MGSQVRPLAWKKNWGKNPPKIPGCEGAWTTPTASFIFCRIFSQVLKTDASFQLLIITAVPPCLVITVIIIIIVNIVEFSCSNRILRALACTNPINPHTPKKLTCTFSHTFNHQIPPKFQSTPCCTQAHV